MSQPRSNMKGNFLEKVAHKSVESMVGIDTINNVKFHLIARFFHVLSGEFHTRKGD